MLEKKAEIQIEACTRIINSERLLGKQMSTKQLAIIHNNRGSGYDDKGQYDRAIADFDKAIQLNPKFSKAFNNRGVAYKKKGIPENAAADYRKAPEIDTSNEKAKNNLKSLGITP